MEINQVQGQEICGNLCTCCEPQTALKMSIVSIICIICMTAFEWINNYMIIYPFTNYKVRSVLVIICFRLLYFPNFCSQGSKPVEEDLSLKSKSQNHVFRTVLSLLAGFYTTTATHWTHLIHPNLWNSLPPATTIPIPRKISSSQRHKHHLHHLEQEVSDWSPS